MKAVSNTGYVMMDAILRNLMELPEASIAYVKGYVEGVTAARKEAQHEHCES